MLGQVVRGAERPSVAPLPEDEGDFLSTNLLHFRNEPKRGATAFGGRPRTLRCKTFGFASRQIRSVKTSCPFGTTQIFAADTPAEALRRAESLRRRIRLARFTNRFIYDCESQKKNKTSTRAGVPQTEWGRRKGARKDGKKK